MKLFIGLLLCFSGVFLNGGTPVIKKLEFPAHVKVGEVFSITFHAECPGATSMKYSFNGQSRILPADLYSVDLAKAKTKYTKFSQKAGKKVIEAVSKYQTFFSIPFPQEEKKYTVWIYSGGGDICLRKPGKEIKWIWNRKMVWRWLAFGRFSSQKLGKTLDFMSGSKAPFVKVGAVLLTTDEKFSPIPFRSDPTTFYWTPGKSAVGSHTFQAVVEADGNKVVRDITVTVYDESEKEQKNSGTEISSSNQFAISPAKSTVKLSACPVMNILSKGYSSLIANKTFGLKFSSNYIQPFQCNEYKQLPRSVTFKVERKAEGLAFILSEYCQGEVGQQTGCIIIDYEDGSKITVPLREEYELSGTLRNRHPMAAIYLGTVNSSLAEFNLSLFPWKNPTPDKTIKNVTITNKFRVKSKEENTIIPMNVISNSSLVLLGAVGLKSSLAVDELIALIPRRKKSAVVASDVSIDFNRVVGKISPMVFSTNETDVMRSDTPDFDQYLKMMNRIGCPILRFHSGWSLEKVYPKGLKNKYYDKLELIISKLKKDHPERQVMICFNRVPKYVDPKTVAGRKLFASLCADLVKELNVNKKFGIKYWEIYNEVYFKKIAEDRSLWKMYNEAAKAMKQVDPAIKIGGYAPCWPSVSNISDFYKHCHQNTDFVSWHKYLTGSNDTSNEYIMSKTNTFGDDARAVAAVVKKITPGKKVELAITEYNINWNWKPHDPRQANHIGAAWLASVLNHLIRANVDIAQTWHSRGGGTFGLMDKTGTEIRPVARVLYWGNHYIKGDYVESRSSNKNIECLGFKNSQNRGMLIINKSSKPVEVDINLLNFTAPAVNPFEGSTKVYSITESGYKVGIDNTMSKNKFTLKLQPFETRLLVVSGK